MIIKKTCIKTLYVSFWLILSIKNMLFMFNDYLTQHEDEFCNFIINK